LSDLHIICLGSGASLVADDEKRTTSIMMALKGDRR
jgi:hypothetical protein